MPSSPLGRAVAPARSVPIRLPRMRLPVVDEPLSCRPCCALPESTLPSRLLIEPSGLSPFTPPMVLAVVLPSVIPSWPLPRTVVPSARVPTRLPITRFPRSVLPGGSEPSFPVISMPFWPLPETTFPPSTRTWPWEFSLVTPPIVFADELLTRIPSAALPRLTGGPMPIPLPVARVVPMALPDMTLESEEPPISIPLFWLDTIRLPAPADAPPIVFCVLPAVIRIPSPVLPRG